MSSEDVTTYRIDLAYDGAPFHGYARQPNVPTVQAALEDAMEAHLGPVETFVAGRTDKGVHATGQVVSFTTDAMVDVGRIQRSLNKRLAPSIAVQRLSPAADGFHARHSATGRRYHYHVLNRAAPDPFLAGIAWHYSKPLDVAAMNEAIAHMVGRHDFASLCRKAAGRSTVRELRTASWSAADQPGIGPVTTGGGLLRLQVWASSFCHKMVRSIVAVSIDVGRGRWVPEDVPPMLEARDRKTARGSAPAHGLTLVGVDYD